MQAAVQANHFGVMQVHNLKETMIKKGVEFAHECLILEVCQPQQAKKVRDENMGVSTVLPCGISIYQEGGKAILATLKPTTLLALCNTPQLKGGGSGGGGHDCEDHEGIGVGLIGSSMDHGVVAQGVSKMHCFGMTRKKTFLPCAANRVDQEFQI